MKPGPRIVAGAIALALLAVACASPTARGPRRPGGAMPQTPGDTMSSPKAGTGPAGRDRPEVPKELRFTAPALAGGTIRGADFAGSDLVIWFWAPW